MREYENKQQASRWRTIVCAGVAAVVLVGVLGMSACSAPHETEDTSMTTSNNTASADGAYRKITAEEGQQLIDAGNVTIVDVRTPQEYAEKHLPGALNIPVENIGQDKPAELTDTEAQLIVYCRTGVRSKQAADKLISLGYQHLNDMGGIVDWHGETVSGSTPDGN